MKRYSMVPALALGLVLPPVAAAQTTPQQQKPQQQQQQPRTEQGRQAQSEVLRADNLIGQALRGANRDRLGRIDDLAINLSDGRIAYAVVNRGGMWGIGGETVAVQWQQIQPNQADRAIRVDQQALQQARQIDTDTSWPTTIGEEAVGTTGAAKQRNVVPLSNLLGMDVQNSQGENLGQIDDVAIARDGSVRYVVVAHGGFLGMGDQYVAVPWDRLNVNAQREAVTLDIQRQQLEGAKSFDRNQSWPARVDWPFGGNR